MMEEILELLDIWDIWRCFAETTLSGNYANTFCYLVPTEISDALVIVTEFIAGLLFGN
jgi:hypothetical protein